MDGFFRSILLPLITAVAQLPATSQTIRLLVLALAFSDPASTDVDRENELSPLGFARPLPESLAVHASVTLSACHTPSADGQTKVGATESSGGLLPLIPASIHV